MRRGGRSGGGSSAGAGAGGMQQLMKQANQMQSKVKKKQEELDVQEYEGTSGGGAVTIKCNGTHLLTAVKISPDVIESDDAEMLEDMILAAANDAIKIAKETSQKEMDAITGGFGGMSGLM